MASVEDTYPLVYTLNCGPGIQRDGTLFDSARFIDGQWVRFQRGRPKKIGGMREINSRLNGPVRCVNVWSRQSQTQVTFFSPSGIEATFVDSNGIGSALLNRTPASYVEHDENVWQVDTMYDAAAGSSQTLLLAHAARNRTNIDSGELGRMYYGDVNSILQLQHLVEAPGVSGGFVVIAPYLVLYGSDGRVTWSNQNEPRNFTTGDAGTARVTGTKVVRGMPIRGVANTPAALLWSLDSVYKMSYIGGQQVFKFEHLSGGSTVLSSSSFIEFDGVFYWVGLDRFMMFNGRVQELPNDQNLNWFFNNLNFAQRQKVHVTKVPRYGEIWWHFPFGESEECTHAVVYNVRENYWYDVKIGRSACGYSQVFRYPLWMDSDDEILTLRLRVANVASFVQGDVIIGASSGARGTIHKILDDYLYIAMMTSDLFEQGEQVSGNSGGTSLVSTDPKFITLHSLWMQEFGSNKVKGDQEAAILSYFETPNFGFPTGGPEQQALVGQNRWTRLSRLEPDFVLNGAMKINITGNETANAVSTPSEEYLFNKSTEYIDLREQRREIRLRFTSNEKDGDYEMGRILLHIEQGDARN